MTETLAERLRDALNEILNRDGGGAKAVTVRTDLLSEIVGFIDAASTVPGAVSDEVRGLTLSHLQQAHIVRQEEWCPDQKPDLSFRGNEMAGEVGEACNVIKKLERERHGWRGSRATKKQLAEELADVVHTATLCAITAGIELEPAVIAKFDATSEKNGLIARLSALQPAPASREEEVTARVRVPIGQTPLNDNLHHPLMDAFNAGFKARDTGDRSPYHGHSLEHLLHACGWVQRDLRLALDEAKAALVTLSEHDHAE